MGNREMLQMKAIGKLFVTFGLAGLMVVPAMAQQGGGRGGFGGGGFGGFGGGMLLSNKGVQKEINATDEQAKKLDALAEETREKARENMAKLKDATKEERQEKFRELATENQAELHKSLTAILKPEQVKRFHQIQIQTEGIQAFSRPRVQERLKLTDDQKAKIREIGAESMREGREARESAGDDRAAARTKMVELRKSSLAKVNALLTADQKETWKELTGEPYEVQFERPGGNNN